MMNRDQAVALGNAMRTFSSSGARRDGWENQTTGLGTYGRDKTMAMEFNESYRLTFMELSALYHHNDIAAKVIDFRPTEMFREGFLFKDPDPQLQSDMTKEITSRELTSHFLEGIIWGRLYGGDLLVVGANDGLDPSLPLDETNIQSIDFFTNVDRRYVVPHTYYLDSKAPKYLQPETYQIIDITGVMYLQLHETRTIRFGGARTDQLRKRANNGWDYSILQRVIDVLRGFEQNWKSCDNLVSDASQGVFKIKGLVNAVTSPEGQATMRTRMELVDMSRSVARALLLDAGEGEEFERVPTSFAGLADLLDRSMMRLSAATGYPVAILMGRSAAGLNATGDSDFKAFYDSVAAEQTNWLAPLLRQVLRLLMLNKSGPTRGVLKDTWTIEFPSLWQATPKEAAEIRKLNAEADQIRVEIGQWLPSELALARAAGGDEAPVKIDEDVRKQLLKHEKEMALTADPSTQGDPASGGGKASSAAGNKGSDGSGKPAGAGASTKPK